MTMEITVTWIFPPTFTWTNSKFQGILPLKKNHYVFQIK